MADNQNKFVFNTKTIDEIKNKADLGFKTPRHEKYWLNNLQLVKKENIIFERTDVEIEEYMKCMMGINNVEYINTYTTDGILLVLSGTLHTDSNKNPEMSGLLYFSEKYCKIKREDGSIGQMKLRDYQKDILNLYDNNRFSILMSSRQSGKTVSAAITILHYIIFNNDKTIMIVANKLDTVVEIVDKIKAIYYLLPWFIKPGVSNWTQSQITFDTGCRIRTAAATKSAAIGFSCDLIFLDEMAHIQANIIEDYYRSVFPTIAAIKNSKIIITSTPNGYNLFYKILTSAEKPVGDKEKNNYNALRVYWWQVPGRYVTYIRLDTFLCEKFKIDNTIFHKWISDMGFKTELIYSKQDMKYEIHIQNKKEFLPEYIKEEMKGKETDDILSNYFRSLIYEVDDNKYRIKDFADISSWKEDAIKDIGGEDNFNQEFDLQFANGNKVLFDSQTLDKLTNDKVPFVYQQIDKIDRRTFLKYEDLTWIKDMPDIFDLSQVRNYHMVLAVDLSEGLGQDFSVINIFRIMNKPMDEWPKSVECLYDMFKLEQVGIFKSNIMRVSEIAEILYLLSFEVFNSNNIGVVLEVNAFGGELISNMRELWNGRNEFSNHIFFRYKHREDAIKKDIGLKIRTNKNIFVRNYQKRIKTGDIIIHEEGTLKEMTTFVKKETRSGNIVFEADAGGHDDSVMTIVATATTFDNTLLHELMSNYMNGLSESIKNAMEKKIGENPNINGADYSVLFKAQQRSNNIGTSNNPWKTNWNNDDFNLGTGSNPWS